MLLGIEINDFFSKLFAASGAKNGSQNAYERRVARNEHSVPLMQIVEHRVSQRKKEARMTKAGSNATFANEVGPPPLTPATMHRQTLRKCI